MSVVIIDYGVGNLSSIKNMLKKIGVPAIISDKEEDIAKADKLILPGVGSFDYGISQLRSRPYYETLNKRVLQDKIPVLGICLGVQLLFEGSAEGVEKGLGWIPGRSVGFDRSRLGEKLKVPHMGWAEVVPTKKSKLFTDMYNNPRFYFVHSFHLMVDNASDALVNANHGYDFVAGVEHENIYGVQFHPEKSHKFGMKLLENFIKYC